MKTSQNNFPPVCPSCDGEGTFRDRECDIEQQFRNETFSVHAACAECHACGFRILLRGQTDALRQKTADAYRMKHGLLTSSQIRELRASRGLSQKDFAELVCVGVASIKRWEHCGVQDQSSDQLMRVKAGGAEAFSYQLSNLPKAFSWSFSAVDCVTNIGHIRHSVPWTPAWDGIDYGTRQPYESTQKLKTGREADNAFAVAA
jgi:putative zinc finger/helix-turn-helix YgiT family protein